MITGILCVARIASGAYLLKSGNWQPGTPMFFRMPYSRRLAAIEATQLTILAKLEKIMASLSDLQASVAAEDTVIGSAITLIQGLSAALAAAGTDPAALAALKSDIDARASALAAAVAANTPAAPAGP